MTELKFVPEHWCDEVTAMAFDRAWKIAGIIGDHSDDFIDLLIAAVLEDYEAVIDAFEKGPAELRALLVTASAKQEGGG